MQRLIIEIYKAFNNISELALGDFFIRKESGLSLLSQLDLSILSVTTVRKGQNT